MVDFNGDVYSGQPGPANLGVATVTGKPAAIFARYTQDANFDTSVYSTGDRWLMGHIPANFLISGWNLTWSDWTSGGTFTFQVGTYDNDLTVSDGNFFTGNSAQSFATAGRITDEIQDSETDWQAQRVSAVDRVIALQLIGVSSPVFITSQQKIELVVHGYHASNVVV